MTNRVDLHKSISERIRAFRDEIITEKVDERTVQKYKIPEDYLAICKDPNHPSCILMRNRLFEYLMTCVGYYANIDNEIKLLEIQSNLEHMLLNPEDSIVKDGLYIPGQILGVQHAIDKIERMGSSHNITFAEITKVSNVKFEKKSRGFQLFYNKDPRVTVSFEDHIFPASSVQIEGEMYTIPKGGGHVDMISRTILEPDEISVVFDKLYSKGFAEERAFYYRYITEIDAKENSCNEFQKQHYDIDGKDTVTVETSVGKRRLLLYNYSYNGKKYLVIEYDKAISLKEMSNLSFSALVALGMITTVVHLNECWLFAYDSEDKQLESGFIYQALVPSVQCSYRIFTTNVYSYLINVAKQIDPINGEQRAVSIIDHLKLNTAIKDFKSEVFGSLIDNMLQYEDLQRGIFIILMGSSFHLEIQAAVYCVALETISNLAIDIIGQKQESIINDKSSWRKVHKRFRALLQDLLQQSIISDKEKKDLEKKIDSLNKAFNSEKLRSLLEFYRYPLRKFDELTLFLRNLLLHGSIKFKVLKGRTPDDYLFELSMNLHKLCCSIALLMSGFEGYIINNRKLFGYQDSYKAFIRIGGNNLKVDYPEYHERPKGWGRVKDTWKRFCMLLSSLKRDRSEKE